MAKATVWKFEIEPGHNVIAMPEGARPLSVQEQGATVQMWALVPLPAAVMIDRYFECYGTGHEILGVDGLVFIGTFQITGGSPLVFHLFERTR